MSNLISIKNRINVVHNTQKITNAMQLVSISKMRRLVIQNKNVVAYQDLVESVFASIVSKIDERTWREIYPKNNSNATLYIMVTSDLGLCGSYNSSIINEVKERIQPQDYLIILGQKGLSAFAVGKHKEQILDCFIDTGDKLDYQIGNKIASLIFKYYNDAKISNVKIIYTKFINNLVQQVTVKTLFPYDLNSPEAQMALAKEDKTQANLEIEPNVETILKSSYPLYIASMIYTLATNSKISELAARRIAMENATDNADEIIKTLKLEYNRKRQSNITQEITEIVSGADATNN